MACSMLHPLTRLQLEVSNVKLVFPTLDPRVERRSLAAARAEGCKRGWAWVLECVLSPQRSDMVSREEIERGTHACKASKVGPVKRWWTQDCKLGITIQDPPPESGRRTHLLYFNYSYCILSRVWKLATSLFVLRHYEHLFLLSILILHAMSSRFAYIC